MNPYRFAFALTMQRLAWDLCRESWRSRRRLQRLRNSQAGGRAVILCNGPSLLRTNFELLDGVYTIGLNKINLLFERSTFRPRAIVAVNPHVIGQNKAFYNETEIPLFLDSSARFQVAARNNVTFLHSSFQTAAVSDISVSLNQGYTVTFVAMQLALHLGFAEVAVVGCDHNFAVKGPANAEVSATGPDQSHFDPRYFSGGQSWNLPDLVASEYYYSLVAERYMKLGRKLWNCTEGGALELLPRCELGAFVRGRKQGEPSQ